MKIRIAIGFFLITVLSMAAPTRSAAGWDVSINIPFPGMFYYYAPPVVVPAPVPYAYGVPAEWPLFYSGYWYRPSGGRWFISAQAAGPWYGIGIRSVPAALIRGQVYRGAGRGADGRYVPPRMRYEDGGHLGRGRGHQVE
jgi:hypothetical protein